MNRLPYPLAGVNARPSWAVAYFYRGQMRADERAAVASLLAFQANPTTNLEPILDAVALLRRFWKANRRALVLDTEAAEILESVTFAEEEANPGRFVVLSVEEQSAAILGQSLAWIFE